MKSIKYTGVLGAALLLNLLGHAEEAYIPMDTSFSDAADSWLMNAQPRGRKSRVQQDNDDDGKKQWSGKQHQERKTFDKARRDQSFERPSAGFRQDKSKMGMSRRGDRVDRREDRFGKHDRRDRWTWGDRRRGRDWYRSYKSRFWSRGFIWPRVTVFNTFFTGLIPQLEDLGIPQSEYESLLAEIQQLQSMLAQQSPDAAVNQVLQRRLVQVIGRLVELVPGIDVQSLFQGGEQP